MSFEMCNFDPAEENSGLIASTREVYSGGKRNFQPRYLSRKCTIMSALDGAKAVERHQDYNRAAQQFSRSGLDLLLSVLLVENSLNKYRIATKSRLDLLIMMICSVKPFPLAFLSRSLARLRIRH